MKPGRELDVLVGRHVMGDEGLGVLIPEYSKEITFAWNVAEHLMRHGITRVSNGDGDSYDCDFLPFAAGLSDYRVAHAGGSGEDAKSAAHAICLVAIRALGFDV